MFKYIHINTIGENNMKYFECHLNDPFVICVNFYETDAICVRYEQDRQASTHLKAIFV